MRVPKHVWLTPCGNGALKRLQIGPLAPLGPLDLLMLNFYLNQLAACEMQEGK